MTSSIKDPKIQPSELILSLSKALDLVSPALADHHMKVAVIAFNIVRELNLTVTQLNEIVLAAALHDIGAFSNKERIATLSFEMEYPHQHAEVGYQLLKTYKPFFHAADIVRFHHVPWKDGSGAEFEGKKVPLGSHILHLADRVAVLVGKQREVLVESKKISEAIEDKSGGMFMPVLVEVFRSLVDKESFWLDAASPTDFILPEFSAIEADMDELLALAKLFSRIIDFRSRFTTTHSSGVAASAMQLARFIGFSERECRMMEAAGYLHDLGKLAVPTEILEKATKLTEAEYNVIRSHTYYTFRILAPIDELYIVNQWASFHHERLDGNGYPFHHKGKDLALGSRIMAVADVFTAITEDRPYREVMSEGRAMQLLQKMGDEQALDTNIVSLLSRHFAEINSIRIEAQRKSVDEYNSINTVFSKKI